jgi:translation initiation factor IF-2
MAEQSKPQGSGRLDTIMTIKGLIPEISAVREQCQNARADLEGILNKLRERMNEEAKKKAEELKRINNVEKFGGYIKKLEQDKQKASDNFDAQVSGTVQANTENNKSTNAEIKPQTPQQTQPISRKSGLFGRPNEPDTYMLRKQQGQQNNYNKQPNPNFTGNRQRQPYGANNNANRPQGRTWTPAQATAGYGSKPPFQQREFRTGQGYTGYSPRPPYGQRATGGLNSGLPKPTERFTPKVNTFDNNKKKGKSYTDDDRTGQMDRRALLRRGIIEEQEIEERMLTRIFKTKKSKENANKERSDKPQVIIIEGNNLTVKTLSEKIGKTVNQIIKQLMVLGQMCAINSVIDFDTAELVSSEFGIKIEKGGKRTFEEKITDIHGVVTPDENLQTRPPVVAIMGHVDHGKTTLLDYLRHSNVAGGESGGITQHIGAYQISVPSNGGASQQQGSVPSAEKDKDRKITFLDTPGHAAFDKMRERGAKITDIAILIVAGDDGVMPQTVEAIKHIQSQNLPMIVAVNKCDKPEFDLEKVRTQLSAHNVIGEEWGGSAIIVPISAKAGTGVDKLLEMILLVADMNNYRANYNKGASGAIIESKMDISKGPIITMLVESGTLQIGDTLLAGTTYGKVRSMKNDAGKSVKTATPGVPVQITGFTDVPAVGIEVYAVDDKLTKQVIAERKGREKTIKANTSHSVANFDPFAEMSKTEKKQLRIILKADVSGSLEAIEQSINNIISDEVTVSVISRGVGMVNDNDVDLASVTGALIIAFNTKTVSGAIKSAEKQKVKIFNYNIIYEIFDFVTEQMVQLFSPKFETEYFGRAEVRALFRGSAIGQIAGCMVLDGKVIRNSTVIVKRADAEIGRYIIESLKIKTDDMKEVLKGNECGIKLRNSPELLVGDIFEIVGEKQLPIIFNGKEYKF